MAEGKLCVCPQCGKKFKLKPEFSAASFACTGCGATVWVDGKPKPAAPAGHRRGASGGGRSGGRSAGRSAAGRGAGGRGHRSAAAGAGRGRRGRTREEVPEDEEGQGRGRYQKPKSNSMNVIFAVVGLVLLIVIPVLLFAGKKGDEEQDATTQQAENTTQPGMAGGDAAASGTAPAQAGSVPGATAPDQPAAGTGPTVPGSTGPAADATTDGATGTNATPADEPAKPTRQLAGGTSTSGGIRKGRYDPEPDIGYAEGTPPELRAKIDQLIDTMFDPLSGIDGQYAKRDLIALGKPVFLPVLARMAKIRDQLPDEVDPGNIEMNQLGASLKLGDELLRELDGYLTANEKDVLRPGHSRKYVAYILRLHYKQWLTVLKDLPEMPGPYDPSQAYAKEEEQFDGG